MNKFHGRSLMGLWAVAAAALATVLGGPVASAQVQAGGNGHALDANQRVGSGRVNGKENQVDYKARNNVITGNVSGLAAFQGQVPYFAPGEFEGQTAGNALFQFNRQSLPSSPTQLSGSAPISSYGNYNPAGTVYRNFSYPGASYQVEAQRVTGQRTTLYDPGNLSQGYVITPRPEKIPSDTIGYVPVASGKLLQVNASPLLGVRETQLLAKPEIAQPEKLPQFQTQSDQLNRPYELTKPTEPTGLQQLLGQSQTGQPALTPTEALGTQLQEQLYLEPSDSTQTLDSTIAQLGAMAQQQLMNRQAAAGDQVYQKVLEKVQHPSNQAELVPQPQPQAPSPNASGGQGQPGQQNQQGQSGQPSGQTSSGGSSSSSLGGGQTVGGLTTPTPAQLEAAERQRQDAVRAAYGLPPLPAKSGKGATGQQGQANQPGAGQGSGQAAESGVLKELSYQMAPLKSLVASRKGRDNKLMAKAEQQIAAGKYFDAEASYQQVLIDTPKRPLARAGLVNAQLGAGLIRSASLNLHRLYDEHPELINLRYGKNLLPSQDRLKWIQQQLMTMISRGDKADQPGLMMAYLGHQVGSRSLVRYGLAIAQTNHPKDPLLTVLGRIWLAKPAAASKQGNAATQRSHVK